MTEDLIRRELIAFRDELRGIRSMLAHQDPDRSYTVEEAAKFLETHPQTVRTHTKIGALPATRIGKRFIYTKADLINFRERRKKQIDSSPKLRQVK